MSEVRLIDANALKEVIFSKTNGMEDLWDTAGVLNAINKAPTVEPPKQLVLRARDDAELELLKEAWSNGTINFTPIVAYTGRPQGEWIKQYGKSYELITNEGVLVGEFTKCPKCQYDKARGSNFCPECGADMRGSAENG